MPKIYQHPYVTRNEDGYSCMGKGGTKLRTKGDKLPRTSCDVRIPCKDTAFEAVVMSLEITQNSLDKPGLKNWHLKITLIFRAVPPPPPPPQIYEVS
jgi:hypothetical protein